MKLIYHHEDSDGVNGVTIDTTFDEHDEGQIYEESKPDKSVDRWCREHFDFIEPGECGRECGEYDPFNGRNGRCKHQTLGYSPTGRKFIVRGGKLVLMTEKWKWGWKVLRSEGGEYKSSCGGFGTRFGDINYRRYTKRYSKDMGPLAVFDSEKNALDYMEHINRLKMYVDNFVFLCFACYYKESREHELFWPGQCSRGADILPEGTRFADAVIIPELPI